MPRISKARNEALCEALEALLFYADPDTYHAILLVPDRPCGEFMDDVSEVPNYRRPMPGAKARAAIEKMRYAVLADDAARRRMKESKRTREGAGPSLDGRATG